MNKYNKVYRTEYTVDINDNNGFVKQLDVFNTYEEAINFKEKCSYPLRGNEYLSIICVDYDEDDNEIGISLL